MSRLHRKSPAAGRSTLPATAVSLRFPGVSGSVILDRAAPVLDGLRQVMRGWTGRPIPAPSPVASKAALLSRVTRRGAGFDVASAFLDDPLEGLPVASAVCAVLADLAQGYTADRPDHLSLHCGAVQIGGRLVAFTGPARAGKSTLIARLALEPGMGVFCDDVLPVDARGHGVALGMAPRLRLPLPDGIGAAFRDGAHAALALRDARYGYVVTDSLVPHGRTAPLAAVVLLSRQPDAGQARLYRLDRARAVQTLLVQNMADGTGLEAELDRIATMTGELACLQLVYSDLEEAVDLIRRAFAGADWPAPGCIAPAPQGAPPMPAPADPAPPADLRRHWQRLPGPVLRRIGDEGFLWYPDFRGYRLNPTAIALWHGLEAPVAGADLAGALALAFPQADPARIAADVAAQLGRWQAEGLIAPQG